MKSCYCCRKITATLQKGHTGLLFIARQLGHADTRMTERRYAHLAPNDIADTIRANFPRLTPSPVA